MTMTQMKLTEKEASCIGPEAVTVRKRSVRASDEYARKKEKSFDPPLSSHHDDMG